jgi:hypothetical protein
MSSYKLCKSVELDPEWFLEGGPVPLRQADKKRVRRVQLSLKSKQAQSWGMVAHTENMCVKFCVRWAIR